MYGGLASALTSRPATSSLCLAGVTSYSPLLSHAVLGVPNDVLRGPGEVSDECALVARWLARRDPLRDNAQGIGVSTTGYLDNVPDGEQQDVVIGYWLSAGREGTRRHARLAATSVGVLRSRGRGPQRAQCGRRFPRARRAARDCRTAQAERPRSQQYARGLVRRPTEPQTRD